MNRKIAVEKSLTPYKDFLLQKGYTVESVDFGREFTHAMDEYDAIVVSGMNKDFLGVEDINTESVVIDAKGLTAEQVYNEVENRLS